VLSELPSPITSGTVVTVEDLKQELTCSFNIKHRFFFALNICFEYKLPIHLSKKKKKKGKKEERKERTKV
jgi:hypothetical protein